jgi:hypothetical protein
MSVTIGSLYGDDQRILEDLHLLPRWEESESPDISPPAAEQSPTTLVADAPTSQSTVVVPPGVFTEGLSRTVRHGNTNGIPWFEEMIEGSGLGRLMKARYGAGVSGDRSTTIEWEVSDWTITSELGSPSSQSGGKRKREEHIGREDT